MLDLGSFDKVALFGGVYNNWLALEATVADARRRGAQAVVFLGDAGGFGPHPNRSVEGLRSLPIHAIQGNYDDSVGQGLEDCQCGYTDPRDNHFAQISYDYTLANTSAEHREWLRGLPVRGELKVGGKRVRLCHGSPRRVNEFLWESTTPAGFIDHLCREEDVDLIACTHTGIHWERRLADGRGVVNVGAIGRPPNDGKRTVWYSLLEAGPNGIENRFVAVDYDWERLAREMTGEGLPPEFVETIRTGWWTTCLEILPGRERARGHH
ncbi:MAG: metallophosphoesterase [Deltaproteobacteria bacterium]|nr:MAG: metallophosphoesterase [Deltaproteobacteria bacterium]